MQTTLHSVRRGGLCCFTCPAFASRGARAVFTTRNGGVSEGFFSSLNLSPNRGDKLASVRENYARLASAAGFGPGDFVLTRQVHGDRFETVTERSRGRGLDFPAEDEYDGLVTECPGVALTGQLADCVPVLLFDPVRRAAAMVHAGWRGTALRVAEKGVFALKERFGCRPEDLLAAVGPSIGPCCFETDCDVPEAFGTPGHRYCRRDGDKYRVDLRAYNAAQLTEAGIAAEHIAVSDLCTCCREDLLYSHRRDGAARGSLAAVISFGEEPAK